MKLHWAEMGLEKNRLANISDHEEVYVLSYNPHSIGV